MKSQRLPGKILLKIGEKTIIEHIAERIATLEGAGVELVYAIADEGAVLSRVEGPVPSEAEGDITLADFLTRHHLKFFTGHATNVLKRFVDASADLAASDFVIRLTADNPFPDRDQLAMLIHQVKTKPIDYSYTADLPLGMGTELIRVDALRSVMLRDTPLTPGGDAGLKEHHREHVTTFIRENPHLYEIWPLTLDDNFSEDAAKQRVKGIRLTVDEEADLVVVRRIYEHFARLGKAHFNAIDVIQLAKNNPAMLEGNADVLQRDAQSIDPRVTAKKPSA